MAIVFAAGRACIVRIGEAATSPVSGFAVRKQVIDLAATYVHVAARPVTLTCVELSCEAGIASEVSPAAEIDGHAVGANHVAAEIAEQCMCDRGPRMEAMASQRVTSKVVTGRVGRGDVFTHELCSFTFEGVIVYLDIGCDDGATRIGERLCGVFVHFGERIGAALGRGAWHVHSVGIVAVIVDGELPVNVELDLFEGVEDVFGSGALVGGRRTGPLPLALIVLAHDVVASSFMASVALFGAVFVGQPFPLRNNKIEKLVAVVQRVICEPVVGLGHQMTDTRVRVNFAQLSHHARRDLAAPICSRHKRQRFKHIRALLAGSGF